METVSNTLNKCSLISEPLTEICIVERAKKNLTYPKGTIYVQVSAAPKYTNQIWHILESAGTVESKYAVLIPKKEYNPTYFVIALENATEEWRTRYIGKNINISMDLFQHLCVTWHQDISEQSQVLELLIPIQKAIESIQKEIMLEKKTKKWFLDKMMI